jgi:ABC-type oligopeptide transport system substrate-binding subunit
MSALFDWQMNIGLLTFGADFMDPRNMLDMTWRSQPRGAGRQDWQNAQFDALVQQAISTVDANRRSMLYRQAEQILVSDYGAAFIYHPIGLQLRKPWIKGYKILPDGTVGRKFDFTKVYIAEH